MMQIREIFYARCQLYKELKARVNIICKMQFNFCCSLSKIWHGKLHFRSYSNIHIPCFLAFLHKLTLLIHAHGNLEITKLSFTYTPQGLLSICYTSGTLLGTITGCPSLHLSWPPSPLPHIYLSFISLRKRTGLPGLSPELGIPQCSKIRYNPSYQEWTSRAVVAHAFNPSTREAEPGGSL